jgi:hypothetical protein
MSVEKIVDGQLAAYNAHDLDRFVGFFSDEVEVLSFPSGEVLTDRSGPAFRSRFEKLFAAAPEATAELVSRVVKGRIVVDQERIVSAPGSADARQVVSIYQVGAEKIERMWFVE